MILWDVNLLLYAATTQTAHHERCHTHLQNLLDGGESFAYGEVILAAVVRIATNPRVFDPPASPESVLAFCRAIRTNPQAVAVSPGPRHWSIFEDLVLSCGLRGGDTTDAYLAALAIEHGCEWWTADEGFARFSSLRWCNPLKT